MNESVRRSKERLYDRRPGWVDGTMQFAQMVRERIRPPMVLLDLGAGSGKPGPVNFLADGFKVVGLDPGESISCPVTVGTSPRLGAGITLRARNL